MPPPQQRHHHNNDVATTTTSHHHWAADEWVVWHNRWITINVNEVKSRWVKCQYFVWPPSASMTAWSLAGMDSHRSSKSCTAIFFHAADESTKLFQIRWYRISEFFNTCANCLCLSNSLETLFLFKKKIEFENPFNFGICFLNQL